MTLDDRLDRIERLLCSLVEREQVKQWYSVEEFSRMVGRSEFTCREWCRLGRVAAEKKASGRGKHSSWAISQGELLRYQREGLRAAVGTRSESNEVNVSGAGHPTSGDQTALDPSKPQMEV